MKAVIILFSLMFSSVSWSQCQKLKESELSYDPNARIYELEDALDVCTDKNTAFQLIEELIKQNKAEKFDAYVELAQDYTKSNADKAELMLLEAKFALNNKKPCQAQRVQQRLMLLSGVEQHKKHLTLQLTHYNQIHGVNAKQLNCILTQSRSLFSRGFGRTNSINISILFKLNSYELSVKGMAQLDELIAALDSKVLNGATLHIVGHTDATGDADYNQTLSEERANQVKKFIAAAKPNFANKLYSKGKGESDLLDEAITSAAHSVNRRVEIYLEN